MDGIGSAHENLVELAACGVSKLRAELVLNHGEVGHGVVRHINQWAGDSLIVVVSTFNGEVILARTLAANRWSGTGAQTAGAAYASL